MGTPSENQTVVSTSMHWGGTYRRMEPTRIKVIPGTAVEKLGATRWTGQATPRGTSS